jgi:hypothetical protein
MLQPWPSIWQSTSSKWQWPMRTGAGVVKLFGDLMISATQSRTDGVSAAFLQVIQLAVTKLFVSTISFHSAKRRPISAR